MNEAKNYTIHVLNNQYVIQSDEEKDHIETATDMFNKLVHEIVEHNKHIDHKKAAILAGLRIASQAVHLKNDLNAFKCKEQEIVATLDKQLCTKL